MYVFLLLLFCYSDHVLAEQERCWRNSNTLVNQTHPRPRGGGVAHINLVVQFLFFLFYSPESTSDGGASGGEASNTRSENRVQTNRQQAQEGGRLPPQVPQFHHQHCPGQLPLSFFLARVWCCVRTCDMLYCCMCLRPIIDWRRECRDEFTVMPLMLQSTLWTRRRLCKLLLICLENSLSSR